MSDFRLRDLYHEKEWRRCAPHTMDTDKLSEAFQHFCRTYCYIKHPERGRILFDLYPSQVQSVELWLTSRYSLMLKARQIGFSTLCSVYALWLTMFYNDRTVIMLSRTERDAIKLLAKAKYSYRLLPEWMKYRAPPMNQTQTKMDFANESYIESLPSASDPARGESVYLAIVDELAYLPNGDEAWSSIEPIADVGGRVIALSTANGEGNLFHNLWIGAEAKTNRFTHMFHPWWANGRDQAWYDRQKEDLPEWQLAQEYPDNPEEAFLKSGRPVFDVNMLRSLDVRAPIAVGFFAPERGGVFIEDVHGPLKVWGWPDPQGRYAVGADTSEGLEHGDFTAAHVINVRDGEVVAAWHGRIDPDLFAIDVLAVLGKLYNQALIGVENNNHGLTTLKALHRVKYHPIYMQRSPRYKRSIPTEILGYRTSSITKPVMIDELNMALRNGDLHLHDATTVAEMRGFVRNDKGQMNGSPFDDRVISLGIANQMTKHVFLKQYEPERTPPPGTWGYTENLLYGDDVFSKLARPRRAQEREPIGKQWVRDPRHKKGA